MLINGRSFTVSTERFDILRRMRASAGTTPLLPKVRPVRFPYDANISTIIQVLLLPGHMLLSRGTICTIHGRYFLNL